MPKSLRYTFLIHTVVSLLLGAALLLAPGRVLGIFGWAPIDPLITRLFGAALVALAWSSFRGWQSADRSHVQTLVEMELVFTILGCVGLLRHLLFDWYPYYVWLIFAVMFIFAIAWLYALIKK